MNAHEEADTPIYTASCWHPNIYIYTKTHSGCLTASNRTDKNSTVLQRLVISSLRSITLSAKSAVLLIKSPVMNDGVFYKNIAPTHPICSTASITDCTSVSQLHLRQINSSWYIIMSTNSAALWIKSSERNTCLWIWYKGSPEVPIAQKDGNSWLNTAKESNIFLIDTNIAVELENLKLT